MELGEPRTSLSDVIGGGNNDPIVGPPGPQGPPGADGNIGDFPNSLPNTPIVTTKVYGFANIEISWTFENKVYYQYEVYASKEADFTPNIFNLIHQGQTSTFMYQAKPNETWYFKVCCVNSHGERTGFGSAYAITKKVDDLSNYFEDMAIGNAVIGSLTSDYMEAGIIKGNWIDAKQLTVTDGNGKRTLDIDSFGNVYLSARNIESMISDSNFVAYDTDEPYFKRDSEVVFNSVSYGIDEPIYVGKGLRLDSKLNEELRIPTRNVFSIDEGTIEVTLTPTLIENYTNMFWMQLDIGRFILYINKNGRVAFGIGETGMQIVSEDNIAVVNKPLNIVMRWSSKSKRYELLINNEFIGYKEYIPPSKFPSTINLLKNGECIFNDLKISNCYKTDSEVMI